MLFWFIAALLTLGASLSVLLPLASRTKTHAAANAQDLEVYRDQLEELDRDAARGLIKPFEAEQARAEIARRIIQAGSAGDAPPSPRWSKVGRAIGGAAVLAVPLVSWGLYAAIGSPQTPSQPLGDRLAVNSSEATVDELLARAEGHLAANPADGRGWDVLAPVYLRMGRHADAMTAFRNAIRLEGATAKREAGLGEAIVYAGGGLVSAEAQDAFERALVLEPGHAKANFYVATALAQEGSDEAAAKRWRDMLAGLPADSPWREPVEQALAETGARLAAKGDGAPGPSSEDMAAAAAMPQAERTAMIETMVAGLDEKLRENPRDPEGWTRLVRSYLVLGKTDEAKDAVERGLKGLGADTDEGKKLAEFAATLGLPATE